MSPARRTRVAVALAGAALAAVAGAQPEGRPADAPVVVHPATCEVRDLVVRLALASTRIAVLGHDSDGACVLELATLGEGAYSHVLCRMPADRPAYVWQPRDELLPPPPPAEPWCETVAEARGWHEPEGGLPEFPLTPWPPPLPDAPAAAPPDPASGGAP